MGKIKPIEQLAEDVKVRDLIRIPVQQGDIFVVYLGKAKEVGKRVKDPSLLADWLNEVHLFHPLREKIGYEHTSSRSEQLSYVMLSIKDKEIIQEGKNKNMPVESYEIIKRAKKSK